MTIERVCADAVYDIENSISFSHKGVFDVDAVPMVIVFAAAPLLKTADIDTTRINARARR